MTRGAGTNYSVTDTVRVAVAPLLGVCMLDLTGIMFSSILMLVVIVQAVRLDRIQPWFQALKPKAKPAEDNDPSWRRRP